MRKGRRTVLSAVMGALVVAPSVASATPVMVPSGYITYMAGGWTGANVRVTLDSSYSNPAGCPWTDGYMVDPGDGGATLFSSMLLTAYMAHRKVELVVDGCTYSRPHVIGVNILAQ